MKQKQIHKHREQTCGCQGGWGRRGMEWEFGISRCKLLYIEWINNKVLLCSTGNYIQYSVINHNWKGYYKRECIYIYIKLNHFAVQQKLTRHCKSTIFQLNKKELVLAVQQGTQRRTRHVNIYPQGQLPLMRCRTWAGLFQGSSLHLCESWSAMLEAEGENQ